MVQGVNVHPDCHQSLAFQQIVPTSVWATSATHHPGYTPASSWRQPFWFLPSPLSASFARGVRVVLSPVHTGDYSRRLSPNSATMAASVDRALECPRQVNVVAIFRSFLSQLLSHLNFTVREGTQSLLTYLLTYLDSLGLESVGLIETRRNAKSQLTLHSLVTQMNRNTTDWHDCLV